MKHLTLVPVAEQFTLQQKQEIAKLYKEGKTQKSIAEDFGVPRRTIMKLCRHLGLKKTPREASTRKSKLDNIKTVDKIRELRNFYTLSELAEIFDSSPGAISRICTKYGISVDQELYAAMQSEKMKAAWTVEKRDEISGSKYVELNDPIWLKKRYIDEDLSMGEISKLIGSKFVSTISHHLKRHGIPIKKKEQYLSKLRRKQSKKSVIKTKWGIFTASSNAEVSFLKSIPDSIKCVENEPITLESYGSQYVPDFRLDDKFFEIKPPEYAINPGVDRQRLIKQLLVARNNNININLWYIKGGHYIINDICDIDKYFCLNWKLLFDNHEECYDFLVDYGFKALQYNKDLLLLGLNNLFKPNNTDNELNANFRNAHVVNFIKHFSPYFWRSAHKDYISVAEAFEFGNLTVLRRAVSQLWLKKNTVNIYGLINLITRKFKDFTTVSVFKPWVARFIYDKYLPDGGTVVDPCMGWGGRFLGSIDSNIKYIGIDLNKNSVESHENMRKFIGSRVQVDPEFICGDSTSIKFPKADLIFTSPPYDDTELYYGIDSTKTITKPIYENIFGNFNGKIILNVPKRHAAQCVKIANVNNYNLIEELKMKTTSSMGREATYEPILVFKR